MGTKTTVSFANIFRAQIETKLIQKNDTKPTIWKRCIDDIFPFETATKQRWTILSNKLTNSKLQSSLNVKQQECLGLTLQKYLKRALRSSNKA